MELQKYYCPLDLFSEGQNIHSHTYTVSEHYRIGSVDSDRNDPDGISEVGLRSKEKS